MTCLFSSSIRRRSFEHAALITLACLSLTLFTVPRSSAQTSQFEQQGDRQLKREPAQPQKQPVEHRVALVIGNGAYQNANRLANPVNDAEDMAAALRGLNFELVGGGAHVNQTADQMKRLIDNYGELLGGGGVGLFYYAGHGVQAQGHNYLIPIEANILNEKTLEYDAVDVDRLLARMDAAGNAFNIVILDACRIYRRDVSGAGKWEPTRADARRGSHCGSGCRQSQGGPLVRARSARPLRNLGCV